MLFVAILIFLAIWFLDFFYGEFILGFGGYSWNTETILWLVILSAPAAIVGLAIAASKAMSNLKRFLMGLLGFVFGVIIIQFSKYPNFIPIDNQLAYI